MPGLAKEATLGTAGDSPPSLPANASGVLGYVRAVLDKILLTLVQFGTSATGTEYTRITAGVDGAGLIRALGVDSLGRVATRDASDTFGTPVAHDRVTVNSTSAAALNADATRRFVEIQNTHATDDIYFLLGTGTAASTLGDRLGPGMSWSGYYTGAIQACCPAGTHTTMLSRKWW